MSKNFKFIFGSILFTLFSFSLLFATSFRSPNEIGRKYRFKNLNRQDIYQNGVFYKSLESLNKAMLEITDVTNGYGYYTGKYYYYEKNINLNESFHLKDVYESRFYRDDWGHMVISPDILMPSLRSIPVFPTNNVEPGFSWRGEGEEIHEGILVRDNILRFPVDVDYKYLGDETVEGKLLAKISIDLAKHRARSIDQFTNAT